MTDVERMYYNDIKDKKRNGRGDRHKKRRGGRYVHLQSDHLSRKEWREMNGEVKSYDIGKVMTWEELKALPDDIAREYLLRIKKCFPNITIVEVAKVFNVAEGTFRRRTVDIGLPDYTHRGGNNTNTSFYKSKAWIRLEDWKSGKITLKDLDNVDDSKVVDDIAPEIADKELAKEEPALEGEVNDTNAESFVTDKTATFIPKNENAQSEITGTISTAMRAMTLEDIVKTLKTLGVTAEINLTIKI